MEKKIVTVMLAAVMCVCLAACGEEKSDISEGPAAGGAVTKVTSAAEETESAAEDDLPKQKPQKRKSLNLRQHMRAV